MEKERLLGEGATATVFEREGRAIKFYPTLPLEDVEHEARWQSAAFDAGLPAPRVYAVRRVEGGVELEMARVDGKDMGELVMSKQLSMERAIDVLVGLQIRVQAQDAGDSLRPQRAALNWKIERAPFLKEAEKAALIALNEKLNRGITRICHGDLHVRNILLDTHGEPWLIDWVDATSGDPYADACRTYLLFWQHIHGYADTYLQSYCDRTASRVEDILAWLPVIIGARLGDNPGEAEGKALVALLRERLGEVRRP
jgi:aminoglycoside phosphotransferase (APT) family kinase protein